MPIGTERRTMILNGRMISYTLERKNVKNLNLRIKPDVSVHVSARSTVPVRVIEEFMRAKADFILRALDRYAGQKKQIPEPCVYADGEHVKFLGRDLTLAVRKGAKSSVEKDGDVLYLTVREPSDFEQKKRAMGKLSAEGERADI